MFWPPAAVTETSMRRTPDPRGVQAADTSTVWFEARVSGPSCEIPSEVCGRAGVVIFQTAPSSRAVPLFLIIALIVAGYS
jgi:hypothetical protein